MTEEAMDSSDSGQTDTVAGAETRNIEQYRSNEENVIEVSNVLNPKPMSILQLAYNGDENLLAVARYSRSVHSEESKKSSIKGPVGKIEIWGTSPLYRLKQSIFLPAEFSSVEGLCWYEGRLFSCGTHGHLVEYDLLNESIKKWTSVPGGTKWCMAIHKESKKIAIGSEDGFVVLLQIYDQEIEVEKMWDRQEDRVLCMAWSPDGNRLVTGSPNAVRIWDAKSGQAVDRISLGKSKAKDQNIVWCTAFLDDSTFVTGDSKGQVCIWDVKMGVCSETHQSKLQQIHCLAVTEDKIYCAGVGKEILILMKIQESTGGNKWKFGATRTMHTHEVRAIAAITDSELVSGGVDSYLIASNAPPISSNVIPPCNSSDVCLLSQRLMMVRCIDYAAVFHLPEDTTQANMLFKFNTSSPITCIGISQDGRWCALSTTQTSKIFAINCFPVDQATAEPVFLPSKLFKSFRRIHFFEVDSMNLAAVALKNNNIGIIVLSYHMKSASELLIIDTKEVLPALSTISMFAVSTNTLLVSDFEGNVAVGKGLTTSAKNLDWKFLPKHVHEVTALTSNPINPNTVILFYADGQISEFDVNTFFYKILTEREIPSEDNSSEVRNSSLTTVCYHNTKEYFFLSVNSGNLIGFNQNNMQMHKKGLGQPLYPPKTEVRLGKFLVNVCHLENGDICVVKASHENILMKLPPQPVSKQRKTLL